MKKTIIQRVLILLVAMVMLVPTGSFYASAVEDDVNDAFFSALSDLIRSQDDSSYFGTMTLTIGSRYLTVDDETRELDVAPEIVNDRTMLPIRAIAEATGATVGWDPSSRTVSIENTVGDLIECGIGVESISINGSNQDLDVAPYIRDGRTFLPVRAVAEALEMDVEWIGESSTVVFTAPYQTCRLLVHRETLDTDGLNARRVLFDGQELWVLQFSSPGEAREASEILEWRGISSEPDLYFPPIKDEWVSGGSIISGSHYSWGVEYCHFDDYINKYAALFQSTGVVAVVDTGVSANHSLLSGRVLSGYDFVENDSNADDMHGHGTHVTGIVIDCVGASPVKILPVRVLDEEGSGYTSWVDSGIRYAADHGADVINLSLGHVRTPSSSEALDTAIEYALKKGVLVSVAAGNEHSDTSNYCPAHIAENGVIIVGAGDSTGAVADFSNYGSNLDLIAPGVSIRAALPGNQFGTMSGTSMAAPHLSSAAVLIDLAWGKTLTPSGLTDQIHIATSYGRWQNKKIGFGWLDLSKAAAPTASPTVKSYRFSVNSAELKVGELKTVSVTAVYSDGSTKDVTDSVTWTTNKSSVATVSKGTIKAVGQGEAEITINNIPETATKPTPIKVKVQDPSAQIVSYKYNVSTVKLKVGETTKITVTGVYSDGSTKDITSSAGLFSKDASIASVDANGILTAKTVGKTQVSMTNASESANIPSPISVEVTEKKVKAYQYSVSTLNLKKGDTAQINVFAVFEDGSKTDVTSKAGLTSDNTSVVTVSSSGVVTAKGPGQAFISMTNVTEAALISAPPPIDVTVTDVPENYKYTKMYWVSKSGTSNAEAIDPEDGLVVSAGSDDIYVNLLGVTTSGETIDVTSLCKPYSLDESILECDPSTGKLTILKKGTCYLYFQYIPNVNMKIPTSLRIDIE